MNVEGLAGVGELNPFWRSSMNVKFNGGGTLIFPSTFVDLSQLNVKLTNIP